MIIEQKKFSAIRSVVIVVCVCLCRISDGKSSNESAEHLKLANEYYWLRSVDRGGYNEVFISLETAKKMSTAELKHRIQIEYNELQCSYAFRTLLHIRLSQILMFNGKQFDRVENNYYNFISEVTRILATLRGKPELRPKLQDVMWVYYMYQIRVADLLKSGSAVTSFSGGEQNSLAVAHNAVKTLFEEFSMSDQCKSWFVIFEKPDLEAGQIQIKDNGNRFLEEIVDNKRELSDQMEHNNRHGLEMKGTINFWANRLYLNGVIKDKYVMDILINKFRVIPDRWDSLVEYLHHHYDIAVDHRVPLHQQIKALGAFQHHFLALLKVIMLRITLKHLVYLKNISPMLFVGRYNKRMHTILTAFAKYFCLNDDPAFVHIVDAIKVPITNFLTKTQIQYINDSVVAHLDSISSSLDVSIKCSEAISIPNKFEVTNLINDLKKISRDNIKYKIKEENTNFAIRESLMSAEVFFLYVAKVFVGVHFDVIDTFTRVSHSAAVKRLKELEEIIPPIE